MSLVTLCRGSGGAPAPKTPLERARAALLIKLDICRILELAVDPDLHDTAVRNALLASITLLHEDAAALFPRAEEEGAEDDCLACGTVKAAALLHGSGLPGDWETFLMDTRRLSADNAARRAGRDLGRLFRLPLTRAAGLPPQERALLDRAWVLADAAENVLDGVLTASGAEAGEERGGALEALGMQLEDLEREILRERGAHLRVIPPEEPGEKK